MAFNTIIEAYYNSNWTLITNNVLKFGDFDVSFSNFDYSLRSTNISAVFNNSTSALVVNMTKIRVRQDSKTLFYGYIKSIKYDKNKKEYNVIINSMIDYLDEFKIYEDLYKTLIDAACEVTQPADPANYFYNAQDLIEWIFSYFLGSNIGRKIFFH